MKLGEGDKLRRGGKVQLCQSSPVGVADHSGAKVGTTEFLSCRRHSLTRWPLQSNHGSPLDMPKMKKTVSLPSTYVLDASKGDGPGLLAGHGLAIVVAHARLARLHGHRLSRQINQCSSQMLYLDSRAFPNAQETGCWYWYRPGQFLGVELLLFVSYHGNRLSISSV